MVVWRELVAAVDVVAFEVAFAFVVVADVDVCVVAVVSLGREERRGEN